MSRECLGCSRVGFSVGSWLAFSKSLLARQLRWLTHAVGRNHKARTNKGEGGAQMLFSLSDGGRRSRCFSLCRSRLALNCLPNGIRGLPSEHATEPGASHRAKTHSIRDPVSSARTQSDRSRPGAAQATFGQPVLVGQIRRQWEPHSNSTMAESPVDPSAQSGSNASRPRGSLGVLRRVRAGVVVGVAAGSGQSPRPRRWQ